MNDTTGKANLDPAALERDISGRQDSELVALILQGDAEAFTRLVRKYEVKVRGYCIGALLDRSLAEDAAQEIFLKVFENLLSFRSEAKFSTWLFRITVNHCRDLLRYAKRHPADSLEAMSEVAREQLSLRESQPGYDEILAQRQTIHSLLARLSPQYREVILLRDADDLSYEQIAEALECSLDAVKARLRRARIELFEQSRHFLEESGVEIREGAK